MKSTIELGSWAVESSFDITQHRYAGKGGDSMPGYMTVLEINDPPRGRPSIVSCRFETERGGVEWYEVAVWQTLAAALEAFDESLQTLSREPEKLRGFVSKEELQEDPWFFN